MNSLFERNGRVVVFHSMKDALKKLGYSWIATNVGPHFCVFMIAGYTEYQYIIRNDVGELVTAEMFAALCVIALGQYHAYRFRYWNGDGPVPGTGGYSGTHYFRNIRYINARRAAQYFYDEGETAPRAVRKMNVLPNAWDDLKISSIRLRNWKRFRKTQWR